MIGFYMIVTRIASVYGVELPSDVRAFLDNLTIVITLGLQGIATTPLECLGLAGYVPRLSFWMLVPPVVIVAIIVGVGIEAKLAKACPKLFGSGNTKDKKLGESLLVESLPLVLKALFLAYPIITNVRS